MAFKKMAGTSAVFLLDSYMGASPVERDGMVWQADELHAGTMPDELTQKPAMANALALEGLEEYDPPNHGDVREVESLNVKFVYLQPLKGWVQLS